MRAGFNFRERFATGVFLTMVALLPLQLRGGEVASSLAEKVKPVAPCPALVAAARGAHIPLEGIDAPMAGDALNPGDSITALATQYEKGGQRAQWLIYMKAAAPEPGEMPAKPPEPLTLYTSFGNKLTFESAPSVATVRTLGPFVEAGARRRAPKVEDKTARFKVDKGLLGLGLNQAAAASYRVHKLARQTKSKGFFAYGREPLKTNEVSEGRKLAQTFQITPEEERAWTGCGPALLTYFEIVQQTPGLNQILFKVLDLPSFWSLLRQGGVKDVNITLQTPAIAPAEGATWGLPNFSAAYGMPFGIEINHHPALELTMFVTGPRSPLLACGGIAGFLAENPRDKENYVTLRVISALRGSGSKGLPPKEAAPAAIAEAKAPWGRIVMVGASVTAGFTASEPLGGPKTARYNLGRYLEAALTVPHEPVRNLGNALFFMDPESAGRLQISQALKAKPTLMTGIDFLFWYCYGDGGTDGERLERFDRGLKLLEQVSCPMIVGDIPDASAATNILRADQIPNARVIAAANKRLREWAACRPQVVLLPLSEFLHDAEANEEFTFHHQLLAGGTTRALLQFDQLHPSFRGCATLALAMLDVFESTRADASPDEIRWDPKEVFQRVSENKELGQP